MARKGGVGGDWVTTWRPLDDMGACLWSAAVAGDMQLRLGHMVWLQAGKAWWQEMDGTYDSAMLILGASFQSGTAWAGDIPRREKIDSAVRQDPGFRLGTAPAARRQVPPKHVPDGNH